MFFKKNKLETETEKDWEWFFEKAGQLGTTYQSVSVQNLTFTNSGEIMARSTGLHGGFGYIARGCTLEEMYTIAQIIKRRGIK